VTFFSLDILFVLLVNLSKKNFLKQLLKINLMQAERKHLILVGGFLLFSIIVSVFLEIASSVFVIVMSISRESNSLKSLFFG
jgi:hypothetical protein